jgi:hypothetical protein
MLRRVILMMIALVALLAGMVILIGSINRPIGDDPLPYWFTIFAARFGLWLTIALVIAALIAVIVKFARRRWIPIVAIIALLAGTGAACWGTIPLLFAPLLHRASYTVEQTSQRYHLALLAPLDGDYHYILYECEPSSLMCAPVYRSPVYPPGSSGDARASARLIPTLDERSVRVMIGDEIIYAHEPGN